jgi:2-polyprenyl-6-methoxyphenol hydroxylase-like FAD-dependent oxidoreductase
LSPNEIPTEIAIVGAGPTGLLLATELALAGVRPVVLERLAEPLTMPKANGLVGRVVEALDRRGLYETFSGRPGPPVPVPRFQFGALPLDMSTMDDNELYALPIPQRRMEELLRARAAELGITVHAGHDVTGLGQDADSATLDIAGPDGPYELAARYVVGADGGRSVVRKLTGIGFPGVTDEDTVSLSGQVTIPPPVGDPATGELDVPGVGRLRPASFTRTERGMFDYGMFTPNVYRVAVFEWGRPLPEGVDPGKSDGLPLAELRAAAARVLGGDVPMTEPPAGVPSLRTVGVNHNSRQADRYRAGRVFLVGDAAHVHSGMGGAGLNLGLQDALNLGWKLAAAVRGWAPAGLLDTYHAERHPVGQRVLTQTRAQSALVGPGAAVTALRQVMAELLAIPEAARRISHLMSGGDVRYPAGETAHPLTGRWLPDLPLRTPDGPTRLAVLQRPARPLLLAFADDPGLAAAAAPWSDRVEPVAARTDHPPARAVLLRPDGYVAWAGEDLAGLADALRAWFGA